MTLAQDVKIRHPELFQRIRAQCRWASAEIDLDEYVAHVVLTIVECKRKAGAA